MRKIFKYELKVTDEQTIEMPSDAEILSVGNDAEGRLCAWAIVTPDGGKIKRKFVVVGTGNPFPEEIAKKDFRFLGTVLQNPFVWHVFVK